MGELRAESSDTEEFTLTDDDIISRAIALGMQFENDIADDTHVNQQEDDEIFQDIAEEIEPEFFPDDEGIEGTVRVRIPEGVTATRIAQILKNSGVIESSSEFVKVLQEKGYTQRMSWGTFDLVPGADYEVLADRLVIKGQNLRQ
jgi:hypothetical protein